MMTMTKTMSTGAPKTRRRLWALVALSIAALLAPASAWAQAGGAVDLSDALATAVLPLPDTLREGATVVDRASERVVRHGINGITCLTDPPGDHRLSLVCYPTTVEPYMRRGRELSASGVRGGDYGGILRAEVQTGELYLPRGTMIRNLSGAIDETTGVPDSVRVWSEMLVPFGTGDELGIPETDQGLDPWMMGSGRVGAHVMIRYRSVPWSEIR